VSGDDDQHTSQSDTRSEDEPAGAGVEAHGDQQQEQRADSRVAELRSMQQAGNHLQEVIEDARDAVRAARQADSMRSPGGEGRDAEEEGPQSSG
jgi:hypothetical protein